ncbi:MAG: N-6 DNA methylase [Lachnospiraceae bacterium]|nr:N-6 DNA methylase [Lachnospiraceae bacterium]
MSASSRIQIYDTVGRADKILRIDFGIKDIHHRMIYMACVLAAGQRKAFPTQDMDTGTLNRFVLSVLSSLPGNCLGSSENVRLLIDVYREISINQQTDENSVACFMRLIEKMSGHIHSGLYCGEDIIGMCYSNISRHSDMGKGEIYTPEHIVSFLVRLVGTRPGDQVLDAACGSNAFLINAMHNYNARPFAIEYDRNTFALACANMLIYGQDKDSIHTDMACLDSRTQEVCSWISSKKIDKVIMNPPFEAEFGCLEIVGNVLQSVQPGTACAFILPDHKLENDERGRKLLLHSTLESIIKLPEKLFSRDVITSAFLFKAGIPHGRRKIFTCYMAEDGFETMRRRGRRDPDGRWKAIENRWLDVIAEQSGDDSIRWIDPEEHLSYQPQEAPFMIHREYFLKTMLDYRLFQNGGTAENFLKRADTDEWQKFSIPDLFNVFNSHKFPRAKIAKDSGTVPYVTSGYPNNGVASFISCDEEMTEPGNAILIAGKTQTVTYQPVPFVSGDSHNLLLILKAEKYRTENIQLFLVSAIRASIAGKYSWGNSVTKQSIQGDVIYLPADGNGDPDYPYMEKYMAEMQQKVYPWLIALWSLR